MKALLIGIDAGCLPVFDRLSAADCIPTIDSLRETGVAGPLESQIPPWTPSAWPSMYTGVNPGEHGVYSFVGFDGYDFELSTAEDVQAHRLWTLLDHHDLSSVVVNVPVTSPPDEIDGAIVPGFLGPEDPPTHPGGILGDVREAIGDYRVYPAYSRADTTVPDSEKMAEYCRLVEMRGEAFRYLADRFDPDFGFVEFQKTDTVFHEFDGDWAKVETVYEAVDDQLSHILDAHDPETVFLASDHGMGRYEKDEFRVNSFLQDAGYVETTHGGKGMPTWSVMRSDLRDGEEVETWEPGRIERAAAAAATVGLTARRIGSVLETVGLDGVAKRYAPRNVARTGNEQVDFAASTAYMRLRTELGVRINLAGREPDGVVPPGRYDEVREALIDDLESARAPDGEPVFETVAPREVYYDGPHTEDAVDIVTVPTEFQHFLSAEPAAESFGESTEPWNHKRDGVVIAAQEGIATDAELTDAHLFDIAPTILAALGVPVHDEMDGTALPVVDSPGEGTYPPYRGTEGGAVGERVEDRLSELGYLE